MDHLAKIFICLLIQMKHFHYIVHHDCTVFHWNTLESFQFVHSFLKYPLQWGKISWTQREIKDSRSWSSLHISAFFSYNQMLLNGKLTPYLWFLCFRCTYTPDSSRIAVRAHKQASFCIIMPMYMGSPISHDDAS